MMFFWQCTLVDVDTAASLSIAIVEAADREAAEKKVRLRYKRMFDRMTTHKIRLDVESCAPPAVHDGATKRRRFVDTTAQIFEETTS